MGCGRVIVDWKSLVARGFAKAASGVWRGVRVVVLSGAGAAGGAGGLVLLATPALAAVPNYSLVGTSALPTGLDAWDVDSSGRIWAVVGTTIQRQTSVGGAFEVVGTLAPGVVSSFGASFIRVSPDGSTLAIGDNEFSNAPGTRIIATGSLAGGPVTGVEVPGANFDAVWNGSELFIAGATSTGDVVVNRASFAGSPGGGLPTLTQRVLTGIGGGSGGVTINAGLLYAGVGFGAGTIATGEIRSFDLASLTSAATPTDFSTGSLLQGGPALSASPLAFDALGNILAGGFGGFTSDFSAAIIGVAVIDPATGDRLDLSPGGTLSPTFSAYKVAFNPVSGEALVSLGSTLYRYAIPTPSAAGLLAMCGVLAMRRRRAGAIAAVVAMSAGAASAQVGQSVVEYLPAPGQFVNNAAFNDPTRALGLPVGGGVVAPDNTKLVTLGGFGGTITLRMSGPVINRAASLSNPRGADFIVFGNASFVSGNPARRFAEAAVIEVAQDRGDGQPGTWYVIAGSSLAAGSAMSKTGVVYDASLLNPSRVPAGRSGTWSVWAYLLPTNFGGVPVTFAALSASSELIWGYADCTPTLVLGDLDGDGVSDATIDAARFYGTPDDAMMPGISPGSGGGDAISLEWAVDPVTGLPPTGGLASIDFVRITNAVQANAGVFGEISTEVGGVVSVRPSGAGPADIATTDGEPGGDGAVDNGDFSLFFASFFAGEGTSERALADIASTDGDVGADGTVDNGDFTLFFSSFFAAAGGGGNA